MRSSTLKSVLIWLCLLSFAMDLTAHSIIHGAWSSSNNHHSRVHAQSPADAHHHDHSAPYSSASHDLTPAQHLYQHNQPTPHDRPNEDDRDNTHHLSLQLRFITLSGTALDYTVSKNAQFVLFSTSASAPLPRAPRLPDISDSRERLRTVIMTV